MEKGYRTFVEELRRILIAASGLDESKVFFRKKGGEYADAGDRLFVECAASGETREICGIYTQELYGHYLKGTAMDELIHEILTELERVKNCGFSKQTEKLSDYKKVKNDLFIRLLNAERNEADLRGAVYRTVGDIALVLYMCVTEQAGCITSLKIRQDYVESWGADSEEVFDEALLNTYFMAQPRIYCWEKLLFDPNYGGDIFMNILSEYELNKGTMGNCLSTVKRTNGAVSIFLPGVAARLAELMGADLYLVFTSVHEVMIHNDRTVFPEDLAEVLAETIAEATPQEDYLTSKIYHYCRAGDSFSIVYP